MEYTKSYGCAVLFLKDILLKIHDSMSKIQAKNIAETCFDTVKHFLYILTLKKSTSVPAKVKAMKSIN